MDTIEVHGKEYPLVHEDELTWGELADLETVVGQGYDLDNLGPKGAMALAYISMRRVDPRVTVDTVRNLKLDEIIYKAPEVEAEPVPPASPADSPSSGGPSDPKSGNGSDHQADPPDITGTPA